MKARVACCLLVLSWIVAGCNQQQPYVGRNWTLGFQTYTVTVGSGLVTWSNLPRVVDKSNQPERDPIVYSDDGLQFVSVLSEQAYDQSFAVLGKLNDTVYAFCAGYYDTHWRILGGFFPGVSMGPSTLWKTDDGTSWSEVPLDSASKKRWPVYLFGFDGKLFLQARSRTAIEPDKQWVPTGVPSAFYMSDDGGRNWVEVRDVPWDYAIVGDTHFKGQHFVLTASDVFNPLISRHLAYRSSNGSNWSVVDIVPESDELVSGLGVLGESLYAVASAAVFPERFPYAAPSISGPTVWRTTDGVEWSAVADDVPVPSFVVFGGDRVFAVHPSRDPRAPITSESLTETPTDRILSSTDGTHWSSWEGWRDKSQAQDLGRLIPLTFFEDSLYVRASGRTLRIPLAEFE